MVSLTLQCRDTETGLRRQLIDVELCTVAEQCAADFAVGALLTVASSAAAGGRVAGRRENVDALPLLVLECFVAEEARVRVWRMRQQENKPDE